MTIAPKAPGAISLGEWCVSRGLVSRPRLDECLAAQSRARAEGVDVPRLGQLLIERGLLRRDDLFRALAAQRRELRQCPRCRFQSTVPAGSAGLCPACARALVPSPDSPPEIPSPAREAIPDEVLSASRAADHRFGKYVLVRELGRGGVGRVFLAWDTCLSQYVAVKRLRADLDATSAVALEERRLMLLREARRAIRLRHPGIVAVHDVGRVADDPYISMEYVEGATLGDLFKRAGDSTPYAADPAGTTRRLAEVARAIDHAHTAPDPLIHCDLKPSNIMVDAAGRARVLDFGLARSLRAEAGERADFISGTPGYMAPEQARGDRMDARTDVYAIGAVLYESLAGRTPFVGASYEVLHLTVNAAPAPPPGPAALQALCLRCLERDPEARPSSMEEVARALDAALRSLETPPTEIRPSLTPRPGGLRRRLLLAACLVASLGLGLLLAADRWGDAELARFRPERALLRWTEDVALVHSLKRRVLTALRTPSGPSELRLRGGLRVAVEGVAGADDEGLGLLTSSGPARVDWSALEPEAIVALAERVLDRPTPADRLGLAVYSLRAGRPETARRLLHALGDGGARFLQEVGR